MSVFTSGHSWWEAESQLPVLRGSVCNKGASTEAQTVEPPRQGQCGAQRWGDKVSKEPNQIQHKEKVSADQIHITREF